MRAWLDTAVAAADARMLTARALRSVAPTTRDVIAMGKAAPAMCLGAADALGEVRGVCVAAAETDVPPGIELWVGDHPVPGRASLAAGRRVLEMAAGTSAGCIVLVSGGGSALCESPRPGVDPSYLSEATRRMLVAGLSIEETNLVRGHLSSVKCGGLARAGRGPFPTFVLSDVAGAGPEVVASGPTLPMEGDPERARAILEAIGMGVPDPVWGAMTADSMALPPAGAVTVIGDGKTAAEAIRAAATSQGIESRVAPGWLEGDTEAALDWLLSQPGRGLTVAAGETSPVVGGPGRGGRNTHAALLAASRIGETDWSVATFATDGVDGSSGAAGAIVDRDTVRRGGDPTSSIEQFDSATYLETTGDLIVTGPTGTNVADLWLLWRP